MYQFVTNFSYCSNCYLDFPTSRRTSVVGIFGGRFLAAKKNLVNDLYCVVIMFIAILSKEQASLGVCEVELFQQRNWLLFQSDL